MTMDPLLSKETKKVVSISGADVPKAMTVDPMKKEEKPNFLAVRTEYFSNFSALTHIRAIPAAIANVAIIILFLFYRRLSPNAIIEPKVINSYKSLMKVTQKKITFIIFTILFSFQLVSEQLSPHEYAAQTHDQIIEIIQTKNQLFLERPDLFEKEISDAFSPIVDFQRIARNVMGKYAKSATDQQMRDFSDAFENSLLETYSSTLIEFKDEKINVLPPSKPQASPNKARVSIEIVTSSNTYPGRYSMYLDKEGKWKIINIEINGMNLGKIFRNQFYSLMEKNSEDIDLVIQKWVASV